MTTDSSRPKSATVKFYVGIIALFFPCIPFKGTDSRSAELHTDRRNPRRGFRIRIKRKVPSLLNMFSVVHPDGWGHLKEIAPRALGKYKELISI